MSISSMGSLIEEWPSRIAEVALWLMDHQMNLRVAELFGQYFARLPLQKSPTIVTANALRQRLEERLAGGRVQLCAGQSPVRRKEGA